MAHMGGAVAVAVHSGIGKKEDFARLPCDPRSQLWFAHVGELLGRLR